MLTAADVAECLADCGLRPGRNSVPPGYIVFIYRPNAARPHPAASRPHCRPIILSGDGPWGPPIVTKVANPVKHSGRGENL